MSQDKPMTSAEKTAKLDNQQQTIDTQQSTIDNLNDQIIANRFDLPLLKVTNSMLMIPLVGVIDSAKAQIVMDDILAYIWRNETRVLIMDIAGTNLVDSAVAAHLIKIVKATKLMGCRTIISGLSPIIANNIVNLGVDTRELDTTNTLEDAMTRGYTLVGYELTAIAVI
jgi:rsbT co-antagonist protein RsbR